jgi:dissimilatory sulfite reductase (desulfoviridin) alpha/beta subunit
MSEVDYGTLKKGGFMRQVQKDRFSMRLGVVGGQLTVKQLAAITRIAQKYGKGYIHLTSREGVEIPFIALVDSESGKEVLAAGGVKPGVCGPRVRTVTACQGSAVCPSAAIETTGLAEDLASRYFGRELPHKFKIGVTGCKNNCLKAEENDLGVKGGVLPEWKKAQCTYCGLCEAVCPPLAIAVHKEKPELVFRPEACSYCGKCVKSCPSGAWEGKSGYILSFGGMFGNDIKTGVSLAPIVFDRKKLFKAADAALKFYAAHAKPSERFARTIERVGSGDLQKAVEEALQ